VNVGPGLPKADSISERVDEAFVRHALDVIVLDSSAAGIRAICADLTWGKGGFNALSGMIATALSIGGVVGPFGAGFLAQHLGYNGFFYVFSGLAALAAVVFLTLMPETGPKDGAADTEKLNEEGNTP